MRRIRTSLHLVGALTMSAAGVVAGAQGVPPVSHEIELASADRGPVFYYAPARDDGERRDARGAAILRRRVSLDVHDAPLATVLAEIARQSGLHLSYAADVVREAGRVTVKLEHLTMAAALTEILLDANVDVELTGAEQATLVRRGNTLLTHRRQSAGRIEGQVTDARTAQPMPNATVVVDATPFRATSKNDGRYVIGNIPPGTYTVTSRLLGHAPLSERVTVHADSVARLDFPLAEAAAVLEQVVSTAVGEQRRVELGNSIATINADSITRSAPITQLTDVLAGRAPGVEVLEQQGQVGAGPRIRIRGVSSFTLSNDPIIYIDGVRADGAAGSFNPVAPSVVTISPTPSRLNDIDPGDIASIDVLKGPSAATEYGTDAANGVIVLKTKRGQVGGPKWEFHAEQGLSDVPAHFPVNWDAFGHTTDPSHTPVTCPRTYGGGGPTVANGGCVIDSVTTYQPLDHASTSLFGTGNESRIGGQVSGGTQQLQYFLAGAYNDAKGVLQLPPFFRQQMLAAGQSIPGYLQTPNAMNQANVRGRVTGGLGTTGDVGFSAAYISNDQRAGNDFFALDGTTLSTGDRNFSGGYGYIPVLFTPPITLANSGSQGVRRFTGSTDGAWRPAAWLNARATAGLDLGNQTDGSYQASGYDPYGITTTLGSSGSGYHAIGQVSTALYTIDVGATASVPIANAVLSKTSAGFQYNTHTESGTLSQAYGLTANGSLNGASVYVVSQVDSQAKTVGSYAEESVGWRDRLFLTGAVRVDAGSGFGSQVNAAVYPKASFSWAAVDGPGHRLRLRAAYGESGVQPPSGATLSLLTPATVSVGGNTVSGDTTNTVGNAHLTPERSAELETGFDAGIFNDRVTFEFTYYRKQTHNTIVANVLAGSEGARIEYENLGSVLNYGVEGNLAVQLMQTKPMSWDIVVGGFLNQNRLLSLAPGVPPINAPQFPSVLQYRQVVGYPLFGLWAPQLQYTDANHDGIIEPSEVSQTGNFYFQGASLPTREFTLNTSVSFFDGSIRVGTQVDYRGGNKIQNTTQSQSDALPYGAAFNDPHASLRAQARAVENSVIFSPLSSAYFEDGSFARWRELSVAYVLPNGLTRALHVRSSSLAVLGRNLALWTHYSGRDPEAVNLGSALVGSSPDGVADYGATPLPRSWALRLNLGV